MDKPDMQDAKQAVDGARDKAADVEDSKAYRLLVRGGLIAYGLVHLLIGYLAIQVAVGGGSSEEASNSGALQQLAEMPFGKIILWAAAVGFFVLVLWQLIMACVGYRHLDGFKKVRKRLSSVAKIFVYGALGFSAAKTALDSGGSSGGEKEQGITAKLLAMPGGQIIVIIVGVIVIAVGVAQIVKGVKDKYEEDLDGALEPRAKWFARAGHVAKGTAVGIVGCLFGWAAITYDAEAAGGMDQALKTLLEAPFGVILLVLMGLGLAAYGVYCFFWAKKPKFS